MLVIGMHRSGTSAVSGLLNALGVPAPDDRLPPDRHNPKGYFEGAQVVAFHERVLAELGWPSDDPLPIDEGWLASPLFDRSVQDLETLIAREFAGAPLRLFKDPRLCRLAPLWTEALARSGRRAVAVLPCRHPLAVAASLQVKAGVPRAHALALWLQHVVLAERYTRSIRRTFVAYDELLADWRGVAAKLKTELAVSWPRDAIRAAADADDFLTPALRHHAVTAWNREGSPLDHLCGRVWSALQRLLDSAADQGAAAELDEVWTELTAGSALLAPVVVAYQRLLEDSRLAKMEQARASEATHAEQEKVVAHLRERLAVRSQELTWVRVQMAAQERELVGRAAEIGRLSNLSAATVRDSETISAATRPTAGVSAALHVAFLSGEPDTPGHLYRVERYAQAARAAGATASIIRLDAAQGRLDEFQRAGLVVIWRAAWTPAVQAVVQAARLGGAPILFDIDDLIIQPPLAFGGVIDGIRSQNYPEHEVEAHFRAMRESALAADFGSAPTAYLASRLRQLGRPAFVLPNGFDEEVFAISQLAVRRRRGAPHDGLVRIGYATGSRTHQRDFAQASAALAQVLRKHVHARLVLFRSPYGEVLDLDEFPEFDGLRDQVEWRPTTPLVDLPYELARFDINLAPLEHGNPFCEAKSELKYFEAALVGVPTVASPTEAFRSAITDGETGFLADTPAAWGEALHRLIGDSDLRRRVAKRAELDSLTRYGPERQAELFAALIDEVVRRGAAGARAFSLEVLRQDRIAQTPSLPPHKIVFEAGRARASGATVVTPLHNYANFISEALESVAAQTLEDLELVVVDDGSTDASRTIARRWLEAHAGRFNRVVLAANDANAGLGPTRNVGFALAETPYVLPLDADNRLLPECASRLMSEIRASGAAFAYPQLRQFGDVDQIVGGEPYLPARLVAGNFIDAMALVRRSAWATAGGYAHLADGWEDYDFWCRLAELGMHGIAVAEPLAEYRVHRGSMLRTRTDLAANKLGLICELERRHPWLRISRELSARASMASDQQGADELASIKGG